MMPGYCPCCAAHGRPRAEKAKDDMPAVKEQRLANVQGLAKVIIDLQQKIKVLNICYKCVSALYPDAALPNRWLPQFRQLLGIEESRAIVASDIDEDILLPHVRSITTELNAESVRKHSKLSLNFFTQDDVSSYVKKLMLTPSFSHNPSIYLNQKQIPDDTPEVFRLNPSQNLTWKPAVKAMLLLQAKVTKRTEAANDRLKNDDEHREKKRQYLSDRYHNNREQKLQYEHDRYHNNDEVREQKLQYEKKKYEAETAKVKAAAAEYKEKEGGGALLEYGYPETYAIIREAALADPRLHAGILKYGNKDLRDGVDLPALTPLQEKKVAGEECSIYVGTAEHSRLYMSKKSAGIPEHIRFACDRDHGVIRLKKDSALYQENLQNSRKSCAFDVLTKEQALALFGENFTIIAKSVTNWDARVVEGTFHFGMESAPVGAPSSLDSTSFNMSRLWKSPDKGSRVGEGIYYTFITWGPALSERRDFIYNLPEQRSATLDRAPSRSSLDLPNDLPEIVPAEVKLSTLSGAAIAFTGKSRGASRKQLGLLAIEQGAAKIIDRETKEMTLLVVLGNVDGDAKPSAKEEVAWTNRIPIMKGADFIALAKQAPSSSTKSGSGEAGSRKAPPKQPKTGPDKAWARKAPPKQAHSSSPKSGSCGPSAVKKRIAVSKPSNLASSAAPKASNNPEQSSTLKKSPSSRAGDASKPFNAANLSPSSESSTAPKPGPASTAINAPSSDVKATSTDSKRWAKTNNATSGSAKMSSPVPKKSSNGASDNATNADSVFDTHLEKKRPLSNAQSPNAPKKKNKTTTKKTQAKLKAFFSKE